MEDSIRQYFCIATAGHYQRKTRRWCQIGDGVIVTSTQDLVVWAISPRPRPLPDDAQHLKETEFHAHKWNSSPQSHQAKHRNLTFRFIRTTEIPLSYSSLSISCRTSGLIKKTKFLLSKPTSTKQKADGVIQFLTAACSVVRTHTVRSPSCFTLTPKADQGSGILQL